MLSQPLPRRLARIDARRRRRPSGKRRKPAWLLWAVTLWAIIMGCLVADWFICPWTAVFRSRF